MRVPIPPDVGGDATFSSDGIYRHTLSRWWNGSSSGDMFSLWIGMNPSTGDAQFEEPTSIRERHLCVENDLPSVYIKTNVMDYRTSYPIQMTYADAPLRSEGNLETIRGFAAKAELIVVTCGNVLPSMRHYADETISVLKKDGRELWHFGRTKKTSLPTHALYIKKGTPLVKLD